MKMTHGQIVHQYESSFIEYEFQKNQSIKIANDIDSTLKTISRLTESVKGLQRRKQEAIQASEAFKSIVDKLSNSYIEAKKCATIQSEIDSLKDIIAKKESRMMFFKKSEGVNV